MDGRYALLKAMVTALKADPALGTALGSRIYDGVPMGATHPFLAIGEVATVPLDGDADAASEHRIVLDVVSTTSRTEASGLADTARAVVTTAALAPAGVTFAGIGHVSTTVTGARDGQSWTARVRFRAVTQQQN